MQQKNLVFIISLPRSGSTMLHHVLGSHSEMAATAEPWLLFPSILTLRENAISGIYNHRTCRIAINDFLNQLDNKEQEYYNAVGKMVSFLYGKFLIENNKKIFIDKTSRYYLVLPELFRIFPNAKFIFLVRNPLAVFSSFVTTMVNNNIERFGTEEYIRNDLLEGYGLLMNGYKDNNQNIHFVKYEDIVLNQEFEIKRICDFIGVKYETQMLNYKSTIGILKGTLIDPKGVHKHDMPVSDYLESWKEKLKNIQLSILAKGFIEHLGKELIDELGYSFLQLNNYCDKYISGEDKTLRYYKWNDLMSNELTRTNHQTIRLFVTKNIQQKSFMNILKYFIKRPFALLRFIKNQYLLKK
jgi:sulfotransferase family protein